MQEKNKEGIYRNIVNGMLHGSTSSEKFTYPNKNTLHNVKKGNKLENNKKNKIGHRLKITYIIKILDTNRMKEHTTPKFS